MGWFEWGAGRDHTTGNGGGFDQSGNQVGTINTDTNTVHDTSGNVVGTINSDSSVTWNDGSNSTWHNPND